MSRSARRRLLEARDPAELHRASSMLELFVDLCFVVAVAQAAASLHHALAEDHLRQALVGYPMVFFAIWWAWVNFTWFSSAYESDDDVGYRLGVFVQVAGVLVLAAGVPRAFADHDFGLVVIGYVIMRIGLISLWLRAAASDPVRRRTDLRYASGLAALQTGWIVFPFLPTSWYLASFAALAVADMCLPLWAERSSPTPWHPHHIAERYGLFTIIVLGESLLAATVAVQSAVDESAELAPLILVAVAALVIVCSMWWIYFAQPSDAVVDAARASSQEKLARHAFIWGYGHYVVFGSAAAVGAGVAVVVDETVGSSHGTVRLAALAVAVPAALFVLSVRVLHREVEGGW